jgi:hypothetical protein
LPAAIAGVVIVAKARSMHAPAKDSVTRNARKHAGGTFLWILRIVMRHR